MATQLDPSYIAPNLDKLVTTGAPFGNSDYIHAHVHELYLQYLVKIADDIPAARTMSHALKHADTAHRVRYLEHPSVKNAVQHVFRALMCKQPGLLPLALCERVLEVAAQRLISGNSSPEEHERPSRLDRLGAETYQPFLWSDDNSDDPVHYSFRQLVQAYFQDPVGSSTSASLAAIQRGISLLEDVAPHMARSALSHVQIIAFFPASASWRLASSCSHYGFSGAVFLRQEMLGDPWWVAEHLLHEALHQKLYHIRETHSIIARDSILSFDDIPTDSRDGANTVEPPWNRRDVVQPDQWPLSRMLAAVHVYAHLAILAANVETRIAELEDKYGPRNEAAQGLTGSHTAFDRACFLVNSIKSNHRDHLGPAGSCLISWISQCLEHLAPWPDPSRLRLRLALQRYEKEARHAQLILDTLSPNSVPVSAEEAILVSDLIDQLNQERSQILSIVNNSTASAAVQECPLKAVHSERPCELGPVKFLDVRQAIANALGSSLSLWNSEQTIDEHCLTAATAATLEVIDTSTARLECILDRWQNRGLRATSTLPSMQAFTSENDMRAPLLTLGDILGHPYGTEDFGLFLHSLVKMSRPRSIVELGFGFGCSALWMALATKSNGVGHVWSFDDGSGLGMLPELLHRNRALLARTMWADLVYIPPPELVNVIINRLGLTSHLTVIREHISVLPGARLVEIPFDEPIDLLFSDFRHDPSAIIAILKSLLPQMAPASSIFIDSASTLPASLVFLENLVEVVQQGTIPDELRNEDIADIARCAHNRRITLVHLMKAGRSEQNSVAWLKLDPAPNLSCR